MKKDKQNQNTGWIERFDNEFFNDDAFGLDYPTGQHIKQFIQTEIDMALEEQRNKICEDIDNIVPQFYYDHSPEVVARILEYLNSLQQPPPILRRKKMDKVKRIMELLGCEFTNESWYDEEGVEGTCITLPDGSEIRVYGWGDDIDPEDIIKELEDTEQVVKKEKIYEK